MGGASYLTVTLERMDVADVQESAGDVDRQAHLRPRGHLLDVHVPAPLPTPRFDWAS